MLISIIVSIYNGEKTLQKSLDSLVNQTERDYELILVDDGSTDSSGRICDTYAEKYEFVSVVHQSNGGLSAARKAGYHIAKGEYLMFFDCDDYVSSDLIKVIKERIEKNTPDLILYDYYLVQKDGEKIEKKLNVPIELLDTFSSSMFVVNSIASGWNLDSEPYLVGFVWTRCIKREKIFDEIFISERMCYTEDVLFNIALSQEIKSVVYVEQPLYYYCINENSLTNRYRSDMWKMLQFRQKWISDFLIYNDIMSVAEERFSRSWWSAIMIAFDNACLRDDYISAKKEMKEIRNNTDVNNWLKIVKKKKKFLSVKEKVKLGLIRVKCYKMYYKLKKG